MIRLSNPFLEATFDIDHACWSVQAQSSELALEGIRMRAAYTCEGPSFSTLKSWDGAQVHESDWEPSHHSPLKRLSIGLPPDECGLFPWMEFAVPQALPAVFWRIGLRNDGRRPLETGRLTLLEIDPILRAGKGGPRPAVKGIPSAEARIFANGWQSWNYTGAYGHIDRFRRTRLGFITEPMRVSQGVAHPRLPGVFTSDTYGVLAGPGRDGGRTGQSIRQAALLGFLSQKEHFGSLDTRLLLPEPALKLWANGDMARLDPGQEMVTDWACMFLLDLDAPDPLGPYLEAVWRENTGQEYTHRADLPPAITGWSSWYMFFRNLSPQDVRANLHFAVEHRDDLPLDLVQIDDGFETFAGDWFDFNPRFAGGVAPLAQEIAGAGFTPGLWLAPYIVDRRSRLMREHPDWMLRGRLNRPANAGFLHNRIATALDLTHPAALDYTRRVIETAVHSWGFPFLKLDFLYAAALPGRRHDPTRTRAQAFRKGLETLREAAGERTFLLGCGCPLGPAVGIFDAMRIGADVDTSWFPTFTGYGLFFRPEPDMPSARNATHNSLTRQPLHRRWWLNDPDCLLARPNTRLTLTEVQTLATVISLSTGMFLLSDHLPALPPDRLRLVRRLIPPLSAQPGVEGRVIDWLDSATPHRMRVDLSGPAGDWRLLALFNWNDRPVEARMNLNEYRLPGGSYWIRDFWSGGVRRLDGMETVFTSLPAHGCVLAALREVRLDEPQYLGSDLHISQGLEVTAWEWDPDGGRLRLALHRPGEVEGALDMALPRLPGCASLNGQALTWQPLAESGLYRFNVQFQGEAAIEVCL